MRFFNTYSHYFVIFICVIGSISCKPSKKTIRKTPAKKNIACCVSDIQKKDFAYTPLIRMGKEFQRLRQENPNCCRHKDSSLHEIMLQLGKKLGTKGTHKQKIIEVLGPADLDKNGVLRYYLVAKKSGLSFEIDANMRVKKYEWYRSH